MQIYFSHLQQAKVEYAERDFVTDVLQQLFDSDLSFNFSLCFFFKRKLLPSQLLDAASRWFVFCLTEIEMKWGCFSGGTRSLLLPFSTESRPFQRSSKLLRLHHKLFHITYPISQLFT